MIKGNKKTMKIIKTYSQKKRIKEISHINCGIT